MVRLICIDVDGTLVGASGAVSPDVWAAAARLRGEGMRLAICSGRPAFGLARDYAARLDPDGWHVFQNGSSVLHLPSADSRSHALPPAAVDRLVARARATDRILELYTDSTYAVESSHERARRHAGLLGVPFEPRGFETLHGRLVRAQWLIPHGELDVVLAEPHEGLALSPSVSPVMPDTTFVNMTPAGVDKATAVRTVAAAYAIPLEQVMMVGDGLNDVGVMREVGHPVAMGNAEHEARAVARYEVGHVDAGGLLEAFALALTL